MCSGIHIVESPFATTTCFISTSLIFCLWHFLAARPQASPCSGSLLFSCFLFLNRWLWPSPLWCCSSCCSIFLWRSWSFILLVLSCMCMHVGSLRKTLGLEFSNPSQHIAMGGLGEKGFVPAGAFLTGSADELSPPSSSPSIVLDTDCSVPALTFSPN